MREINEWILGDLLAGAALHSESAGTMFAASTSAVPSADGSDEDDGLVVSANLRDVIELPTRLSRVPGSVEDAAVHFDWLSQPLSGRGLVWTINTLAMLAALLLFALVFLTVTGEAPRWPLATAGGAAVLVGGLYWGFFQFLGGSSPGARLARMLGADADEERADDARFR